jgi:hypothetical protein
LEFDKKIFEMNNPRKKQDKPKEDITPRTADE